MRILMTQDTDWSKRNPGQQHHIAERLTLRGHLVRVIDYDILWRSSEEKKLWSQRRVFSCVEKTVAGAKVSVIRPGMLRLPVLNYVSMLWTINRELMFQTAEFKPDVVIGHSILTNFLTMLWARMRNIPYVFHMTDAQHTIVPEHGLKPIAKILEKWNLKRAEVVIVINERLREYAVEMGARPERTKVIRAGVDLSRYQPQIDSRRARSRFGLGENDIVLFFMGWLYRFSGLKEVAEELRRSNDSHIKLLIVGDGDAFDDLRRVQERENMAKRLILAGKQPYEGIPGLIAAADICLLPAYCNETMRDIVPIKLYEYMAMAKPVISTRLPGVIREFGEDNGIIYVSEPQEVIATALELAHSGKAKVEGAKARRFVENMGWDSVVDKFETALNDIVVGSPRSN